MPNKTSLCRDAPQTQVVLVCVLRGADPPVVEAAVDAEREVVVDPAVLRQHAATIVNAAFLYGSMGR